MINLLPADIKQARQYAWRNLSLFKTGTFLFIAAGILGAVLGYGYFSLNNTANNVTRLASDKQSQLANLESLQKQAQDLADTITTANTLLNRETKFSELLKRIGGIMPSGAALKGLRLTGDRTQPLEITASLANVDQAPILQKNLIASGLFEAADIQSVQRKQIIDTAGTVTGEDPETTIIATFKKDTTTKATTESKTKLPETFQP